MKECVMRIAYLDCFAGISGDMFLGALLHAGVPAEVLQDAVQALAIDASLQVETVDRSGISSTKVHVLERGVLVGEAVLQSDLRIKQTVVEKQSFPERATHSHQPKTQHLHKTGHVHSHEKDREHAAHAHGRSLTQIRALLEKAALKEEVKRFAVRVFESLGHAEAKIHNVPVEKIHFHEVGAVDAIVDIAAASAGIHHLAVDAWYCSPLNVGGGMVECAHGTFPVPAPATADLLRGFPTYSAHVQKELVTPTGAALLRTLDPVFGQQPPMRVDGIGYGAGARNPKDFPNVLRLCVGEAFELSGAPGVGRPGASSGFGAGYAILSGPESSRTDQNVQQGELGVDTVAVLETALDDLSPQTLAYVAETALVKGALDVMLTPVIMKKGRPGTLLTILCHSAETSAMEQLVLRETSTLGVRVRYDRRTVLERTHVAVQTEFGEIRMKVGSLGGEELNAAPEYEDCRAAAGRHGVALKWVQQAASAAYRAASDDGGRQQQILFEDDTRKAGTAAGYNAPAVRRLNKKS